MLHHRTGQSRNFFDPSRDEIESICRFFSIGKLQHFEKEKGITTPHTHLFIFVSTSHGPFALKCYAPNSAQTIATEYAINRILVLHHFPTPIMHAGLRGQPFFTSNVRLITCYSYIDGIPAWKHIQIKASLHQINAAMLSLKDILSSTMGSIPFHKQKSLTATVNAFAQASRKISSPYQKNTIDRSLINACRMYQQHKTLFTRQWIHNNATLTNFLIHKKTVYTLDLEHVWEDYALSDLACLAASCLLLDLPIKSVKAIVKDYFIQHRLGQDHFIALNALVQIRLIRIFLSPFSTNKVPITAFLNKMNDNPKLIV